MLAIALSCGVTMVLVFSLGVRAARAEIGPARAFEHKLARGVLPHFGAALRLRRSLSGLSLDTASAEAVFRTDGHSLNAQGMAEPASARETLRAAVVQLEGLRARPLEEAESPRAALLAGRWSLVDRFDQHGCRFVIAYRNPPGVLDPRACRFVSARWQPASLRACPKKS